MRIPEHSMIAIVALFGLTCAATIQRALDVPFNWCGSSAPEQGALENTHRQLHRRDARAPANALKRDATRFLRINVYFHVVADTAASVNTSPDYITDKMIADQFKYMQDAYGTAAIDLVLKNVTRTTNDSWASNQDDLGMKAALRQGRYESMNVYIQTKFQGGANTPGVPPGSILLGLGTFPVAGIIRGVPNEAYDSDGISLYSGAITGGTLTGYNTGAVLVHESGHWLGLYHVFEGNTCEDDSYGDYVFDTPQTSQATSGCPQNKDTCPNSGYVLDSHTAQSQFGPQGVAGLDPINNFMDYSDGSCLNTFTLGQGYRMFNLFIAFRVGR